MEDWKMVRQLLKEMGLKDYLSVIGGAIAIFGIAVLMIVLLGG